MDSSDYIGLDERNGSSRPNIQDFKHTRHSAAAPPLPMPAMDRYAHFWYFPLFKNPLLSNTYTNSIPVYLSFWANTSANGKPVHIYISKDAWSMAIICQSASMASKCRSARLRHFKWIRKPQCINRDAWSMASECRNASRRVRRSYAAAYHAAAADLRLLSQFPTSSLIACSSILHMRRGSSSSLLGRML